MTELLWDDEGCNIRLSNVLRQNDIDTLSKLAAIPRPQFLKFKNCGHATMLVARALLARHGLRFAWEVAERAAVDSEIWNETEACARLVENYFGDDSTDGLKVAKLIRARRGQR